MQLVHPDDMEAIDGEYYQNFHSFDGDISELGLSFSDLLYCPVWKVLTFLLALVTSITCT